MIALIVSMGRDVLGTVTLVDGRAVPDAGARRYLDGLYVADGDGEVTPEDGERYIRALPIEFRSYVGVRIIED